MTNFHAKLNNNKKSVKNYNYNGGKKKNLFN